MPFSLFTLHSSINRFTVDRHAFQARDDKVVGKRNDQSLNPMPLFTLHHPHFTLHHPHFTLHPSIFTLPSLAIAA
jgi:hypothetical protein